MIDWLVDPFTSNAFMQRALVAGVFVALACAVVGTFVVLRGLAFIGDALAHGVLPGVAAALLWGLPGMVGAIAGAVVMIAGVGWVTSRSRLCTRSRPARSARSTASPPWPCVTPPAASASSSIETPSSASPRR